MQNKSVEIRLATFEDAATIALLGQITFSETFGHYFRDRNDLIQYFERTFSVSKIEQSLKKSTAIYWLAFVDKLPVGYAKLKLNSPSPFVDMNGVCQLQKIYILRDFHGIKIGFKLQTELLEMATNLNFKNIWLSVLDSNEKAISFYKNTGWNSVGAHDFQIGKEYFTFTVMSKAL